MKRSIRMPMDTMAATFWGISSFFTRDPADTTKGEGNDLRDNIKQYLKK
jgi:hypothetical protein